MCRTLVCLLLVLLMLAQAARWKALGSLVDYQRADSELLPGSQRPEKHRKRSTPTPTPTPTPAPVKGTGLPQRYPQPLGDEGNPAESPEVSTLTGTFRLVTSDAHEKRFIYENSSGVRIYSSKVQLEAPPAVALELRGKTVNIVSTFSPQISFEADGREHIESLPDGTSRRVSAKLLDKNLVLTLSDSTGQHLKIVFESIAGNQLRITRHFSDANLKKPMVLHNTYHRVADVAQWASFQLEEQMTQQVAPAPLVPNGESLVATLNHDLTTKQAKTGDRFSMTVRAPSQFEGAIIEGYVTNIKRGGSKTGRSALTLHFDTVRLANGKSYKFGGLVQSVRTPGESATIDNEASVRDENQGTTTVERSGAGAIFGALIGGGMKGAGIGAAIGAGQGAGSVIVQRKDELELPSGSEMLIRASVPR